MKRVSLLYRSLICSTIVLGILPSGYSQRLERYPYPQNLKPDSVEFLWRTDIPTETWVEVTEVDNPASKKSYHSDVPTTAHQIRVPGLRPDTKYLYRVGYDETKFLVTEPIPFQTFPSGDLDSYTFAVYGDHRNYPKDHRAVVEAMIQKSQEVGWPRFLIDTGDFTGQGEHKTDFYNEQFFEPARGFIERVCYFPVIGNHEASSRDPRIPFRYLDNFSVPVDKSGTEYFYSFDFADAHFTMIDGYATDFTSGTKQHAWIRQDLKNTKKKWKFAVVHYPIFIHRSGPTVSYGNMAGREHLVPLFERYGVTAVFSGDSHFYQRSEVNGIHYICSGGGGAPLYDPGNGMDYVRASKKTHHYAWLTISGDKMKMDVFDTANQLIDTLTTGPREALQESGPPLNFVRRLPQDSSTSQAVVIVESRNSDGKRTAPPLYLEEGTLADSSAKSSAPGLSGKGSRFSDNTAGDAVTTVTPKLPGKGTYLVSITVPEAASVDAPNSLFVVTSPGSETIRGKLPLTAGTAGNKWYDIGLFDLAPGASFALHESEEEPDRFYIDAVRFALMKPD